ncbi:uncharacterized protein Triagg1_5151 [Trichoderma aggressivum f. europaeum]|uniref:F-box domain-containing protein n=1 Tax=Trichoderma aggressivum f. europaeum TaxID=173218 RepID=A0AAE1M5B6_9HYPO|nr:hypothetical protein Triagg1_5151 [Trichoderma aggressivum f. europaeum]
MSPDVLPHLVFCLQTPTTYMYTREMDASVMQQSTEPHRSASLELLAPEILLQIVTQLPGLDTLWNLMRASPQTWRLFDRYALVITEGILSGPNSVLPSSMSELVRAVILLRSGALPFRGMRDVQLGFIRCQFCRVEHPLLQVSISPELLATSSVPVATLRSVVATAYHLSSLAQACLESCLVRIRDPSFRPMHAYDPPAQYLGRYIHNGQADEDVKPEDRIFVGTPVQVVDAGEPSWIEEMRALRAMWIIQFVGELQRLVGDRSGTMGWSEEDIKKLSNTDAVNLANCIGRPAEELNTAMLYLKTRGDAVNNMYYRLPRAPSATTSARRTMISPKLNKNALIVYGFRRDNEIHALTKGSPVPEDGEPVLSSPWLWGQAEHHTLQPSAGAGFFFRHLTAGRLLMVSPLKGVKFDSFRPMGFAFWDRWRMYLLGLLGSESQEWTVNGKEYLPYFYYFAWESIMPPEEVASVKAAIREKRQPIAHLNPIVALPQGE